MTKAHYLSRLLNVAIGLAWVFTAGVSAQTTVNFTVNVISAPPCQFNGGNNVAVSFGNEVLTTRVDGVNYQQPVPYNLTCSPAPPVNALKLQFRGTDAGFDSSIQTNNGNLGIRLMNGNNPLPPNTWVNFTWPNIPVINAVPVKRPGSDLAGGAFSGAATLMVDYQ